jgi:hypothetical protein
MARCFIIQPFDNDKFDARYRETFKPAIEEAGFEPYRVDEDVSVLIPINDIEQGIRSATVCFAEISKDNANVWYELGYAVACARPVVMVCEKNARLKLPFDIQHRSIIYYDPDTASGFEKVKTDITARLRGVTQDLTRKREIAANLSPEHINWIREQFLAASPRQ